MLSMFSHACGPSLILLLIFRAISQLWSSSAVHNNPSSRTINRSWRFCLAFCSPSSRLLRCLLLTSLDLLQNYYMPDIDSSPAIRAVCITILTTRSATRKVLLQPCVVIHYVALLEWGIVWWLPGELPHYVEVESRWYANSLKHPGCDVSDMIRGVRISEANYLGAGCEGLDFGNNYCDSRVCGGIVLGLLIKVG